MAWNVKRIFVHDNAHFLAIYRCIWSNNTIYNRSFRPYYLLNFGIITINELSPKIIIRFTLTNIRNNLRKSWTQLIEEETLEDLFDCIYGAIEMHKIDVW